MIEGEAESFQGSCRININLGSSLSRSNVLPLKWAAYCHGWHKHVQVELVTSTHRPDRQDVWSVLLVDRPAVEVVVSHAWRSWRMKIVKTSKESIIKIIKLDWTTVALHSEIDFFRWLAKFNPLSTKKVDRCQLQSLIAVGKGPRQTRLRLGVWRRD